MNTKGALIMRLVTVKKALPVLWRYVLVVAASCSMAYFISQSKVYAQPSTLDSVNSFIGGQFNKFLPEKRRR
jgi:hypothetical protein